MITIKNSQLNKECLESISLILNKEIKAKEAFKMMKIAREITNIIDDKNILEKKILDKWISRDDNGNVIKAKDNEGNIIEDSFLVSDLNGFTEEYNDFLNTEHILSVEKVDFNELNIDIIKPADLLKIEFIFK